MDPALSEAQTRTQGVIDHLQLELSSIRVGRANPSLIENIPVMAYGSRMKLNEVSNISAPQPSLLTVSVWDASITLEVVKAIQEANLGLNPSTEGNLIRLPIPPLTEERRAEFIKLAQQKKEEAKVSVRQIRQDVRHTWQSQKDQGEFGEDELDRRTRLLQELVDKVSSVVDSLVKAKEQDLIQV